MEIDSSHDALKVEEVFRDHRGRRDGMIKALTTDFERCYQLCDPEEENLCLYGYPDGNWAVRSPAEEVPPELPEPAVGINFSRDTMSAKEWASVVAVHSDSWLLSVAFYFGARFEFRQNDRMLLFEMINDLPTLFEVVMEDLAEKEKRAKALARGRRLSLVMSRLKEKFSFLGMHVVPVVTEEEEDSDRQVEGLCGACEEKTGADGFWICCDVCEKWFHGKCVGITMASAQHINNHYKCPSCSSNGPVNDNPLQSS